MGSYKPCSRKGCRHDASEHRQAPADKGNVRVLGDGRSVVSGDRLLIGACHHAGCLCSQYVEESLKVGNGLLPSVYGDHGMGAPARVLMPLPTMYGPDGRPLR